MIHAFRYTTHAREQMTLRRISESQVERVVLKPHRRYESRGRLVAERDTEHGNTVRVVYTEEEGRAQVITAVIITAIRISR